MNAKSVKKKLKLIVHLRRFPKQTREHCTALNARIKDYNCDEVFDGSWPEGDTINFVKNGLIEAGR